MRLHTYLCILFFGLFSSCGASQDDVAMPHGETPQVEIDRKSDDLALTCSNGIKNGTETDVDCGGTCLRCALGKRCLISNDCKNQASCVAQRCVYPYLEDADLTPPPPASSGTPANILALQSTPYPRVVLTENPIMSLSVEAFSKYSLLSAKAFAFDKVRSIKSAYPQTVYVRYFSSRAYQGSEESYGEQTSSMPFWSTGPATVPTAAAQYSVFAGHWLYRAGTRSTNAIAATGNTVAVTVDNATTIDVGEFVVIYDDEPAPARLFRNAEHLKVISKNGNDLVLSRSALIRDSINKSAPKAHAARSIVAMHQRGAVTAPLVWAYNVSLSCPLDANGKTLSQVLSGWLAKNYDKDPFGAPAGFQVDGVMFDADLYFDYNPIDANNDLVADWGITSPGFNSYGKGMQNFYSLLRSSPELSNRLIIPGSPNSRGDVATNGGQAESLFTDNALDPNPTYEKFDAAFYRLDNFIHHPGVGPGYSELFIRLPTKTYANQLGIKATSDAAFRLGLGMSLVQGAFFSFEASKYSVDPWFDEYAVDVTNGSPKFGQAIPQSAGAAQLRAHRGWLGQPLSARKRIYDARFAPVQSLINQAGTFDLSISDWLPTNVTLTRDISTKMAGAASLRVSAPIADSLKLDGAFVTGPAVTLEPNTEYSITFAVRSVMNREIRVLFGDGGMQVIPVRADWARRVVTFKTTAGGPTSVVFQVGRESSPVWIDSVQIFKGNANVFAREFERGYVVVNATRAPRTVTFDTPRRRIKGTQNPDINTGALESSASIPAYDSVIYVK